MELLPQNTHNKIVAITGLTGVGKDYLGIRAVEGLGIPLVNWGTLLSDRLGESRDVMMQTVSATDVAREQYRVCDQLIDLQPVAVTCHTVRSRGLSVEYDIDLERRLNAGMYVYISAPAEQIQDRVMARNLTGERASQVLSVSAIRELQRIKKERVEQIASELHTPFIEIENNEEDLHLLKSNVDTIAHAIKFTTYTSINSTTL